MNVFSQRWHGSGSNIPMCCLRKPQLARQKNVKQQHSSAIQYLENDGAPRAIQRSEAALAEEPEHRHQIVTEEYRALRFVLSACREWKKGDDCKSRALAGDARMRSSNIACKSCCTDAISCSCTGCADQPDQDQPSLEAYKASLVQAELASACSVTPGYFGDKIELSKTALGCLRRCITGAEKMIHEFARHKVESTKAQGHAAEGDATAALKSVEEELQNSQLAQKQIDELREKKQNLTDEVVRQTRVVDGHQRALEALDENNPAQARTLYCDAISDQPDEAYGRSTEFEPELNALQLMQKLCDSWIEGNKLVGGGKPEPAPPADWNGIKALEAFKQCKELSMEIENLTPTRGEGRAFL